MGHCHQDVRCQRSWKHAWFMALLNIWLVLAPFGVLLFAVRTDAQESGGRPRAVVGASVKHDTSRPLRSITPIPPSRGATIREIPLRPRPRPPQPEPTGPTALLAESLAPDPVVQDSPGVLAMPSPLVSFEGIGNVNGVLPPDTNGDVGPNHYVQMVNVSFAIFGKSGTVLFGPADINTLWSGFGTPCETENDGDPIVLYDHLADRWLISQFALPNFPSGPFYQCIAISLTGDPTGAWHRYQFLYSDTKMNDYPKFGVWPDAYYMTANQFDVGGFAGAGVVAFERDKMLDGLPAQMVKFDLFGVNPNFGGMLPADLDGPPPPAGSPNYFVEVDDTIFGFPTDSFRLWEFHVDWVSPAASTFGVSGNPNAVLNTASFDSNLCGFSRNCIPQPSTARRLDAISDRLMYRLQYRNLGTHESLVVNHTVDVDGADHAGIRWYEVRDPGGAPFIHQQGTYAPDALHRWMGSLAMDGDGNMALGFSASSTSVFPSIRYVGRLAGDSLGTLPQGETVLMAGSGSQTHDKSRWGDYSMMAVDPVDDCTFWYTQEYYSITSSSGWRTRIGAFKFPSCGVPASGADLALTKTDSPDPVTAGGSLTYTIQVTNNGPDPATGVIVTDTLPPSVTFVSATPPCTQVSGTVTCNLGNLNASDTATVVITVTPTAIGTINNSAQVTATEIDPNPADNTAVTLTTVNPAGGSCLAISGPSLKGKVTTTTGAGISGVAIVISGPGNCGNIATTNTKGQYVFSHLSPGTYTVTPDKAGCSFVPPSQGVTLTSRKATANFTGTCP